MLHRPMHAAAYLLHPAFIHDRDATTVSEIQRGWLACVSKLVARDDIGATMEQMSEFRDGRGAWTGILTEQATSLTPLSFWGTYGFLAPKLASLAKRVLNLATTTAAAERNWSDYTFIQDRRRNRLRPDRYK